MPHWNLSWSRFTRFVPQANDSLLQGSLSPLISGLSANPILPVQLLKRLLLAKGFFGEILVPF